MTRYIARRRAFATPMKHSRMDTNWGRSSGGQLTYLLRVCRESEVIFNFCVGLSYSVMDLSYSVMDVRRESRVSMCFKLEGVSTDREYVVKSCREVSFIYNGCIWCDIYLHGSVSVYVCTYIVHCTYVCVCMCMCVCVGV